MTIDSAVKFLESKGWTVQQSKLTGKYQVWDKSGKAMFGYPQTGTTLIVSTKFWKKNAKLYFS